MGTGWEDLREQSRRDPSAFWAAAAEAIDWTRRWDRVLDPGDPARPRWFDGGELNTCFNALDRHVDAGRGDQPALRFHSAMTQTVRVFTYAELRDLVATAAGALRAAGVQRGDRVVVYMPMIPEAVVTMLACARLGAVHSVVFGGFAARELATRIDHARPKVVVSASCGLEPNRVVDYKRLLDDALDAATHAPARCLVVQRPEQPAALRPGRDVEWAEALAAAEPAACVPVAATDPLYVLYTSGTTGRPKGVVRDNGGHAVALRYSMEAVYGVGPGETYWAASDIGWQVGHSYIVYGPLLAGSSTVLYEGKPVGTPDPGAFWDVCERHDVRVLFTAPTAIRAIRRDDPHGEHVRRYDLSALRTLFLAGERCDPDTLAWAETHLERPVVDHWWQTETGWPVIANCQGLGGVEVRSGSPSKPVPGYAAAILDDQGRPQPPDTTGALALELPLPPGCLTTLWEDDAGFVEQYLTRFPGFYDSGDAAAVDGDGYFWIMGRTDDVINTAGHRISTAAIEEVVSAHPAVVECAVIGVEDELKGQVPVGLVVLERGSDVSEETVAADLTAAVRREIGPVAVFKRVFVVAALPKTRSGKILRRTMRDIANGQPWTPPATIDDPTALEAVAETVGGIAAGAAARPAGGEQRRAG